MRKALALSFALLLLFSCGKKPPRTVDADRGWSEKGLASWYGEEFAGRPTASGEIFDPGAMTAAHKTLPLGTVVRVENLDNGKEAELRVNDRGPFVRGRIIDCSKRGAKELGFLNHGTAKVKITVVREGKGRSGKSPTKVVEGGGEEKLDGSFTVQVGAFKEEKNAKGLRERLQGKYGDCYVAQFREFYRVRLGHLRTEDEAGRLAERLAADGFEGFVTRND